MSITQVHVSSPHTLMVQDHDEDDRQYINEIRIEMLGVSPTSKRVWPYILPVIVHSNQLLEIIFYHFNQSVLIKPLNRNY